MQTKDIDEEKPQPPTMGHMRYFAENLKWQKKKEIEDGVVTFRLACSMPDGKIYVLGHFSVQLDVKMVPRE